VDLRLQSVHLGQRTGEDGAISRWNGGEILVRGRMVHVGVGAEEDAMPLEKAFGLIDKAPARPDHPVPVVQQPADFPHGHRRRPDGGQAIQGEHFGEPGGVDTIGMPYRAQQFQFPRVGQQTRSTWGERRA
jgi:hypothetical protein